MLRISDHFSDSDVGRQRQGNEDALFVRAPLFVVADGMGGAQAGEVASDMAVRAFADGVPDSAPAQALVEIVRGANRRIHEQSVSDRGSAGMGTTLTAAYLTPEDEVIVAHVGDSRCYLLRDSDLVRLTRDHSLVGELVARGKLTEEQAETHPQRSVITRALGPEPDVEVDLDVFGARDGDVFLICSDGLTSMVAEARLKELLSAPGDLETIGRSLIAAANRAGGRDNITVILFRLEEVRSGSAGDGRAGETREAAAIADDRGGTAPAAVPSAASGATTTMTAVETHPEAAAEMAPRPAPAAAAGPDRATRDEDRVRPLRVIAVIAVILALLLAPAWVASRVVYFLGVDAERGNAVTIYRGVPYELPGGLKLYERFYPSGVTIEAVPPARREIFTDHKLRSRDDAEDLVIALERDELNR